MITHIAFDADDTLWHEIDKFKDTEDEFVKLLLDYHDENWIREKFDHINIENLKYFGYGLKGFTLSMIETAITLSDSRISGSKIHQIIEMAKALSQRPINLLNNVDKVLSSLKHKYKIMLITKGDMFDQESKIARSGLGSYFDIVEIVTKKDFKMYQRLLEFHNIEPASFLMVGNSIKSDIIPILDIGGYAIHIPYNITWSHEASLKPNHQKFYALKDIREVVDIVNAL